MKQTQRAVFSGRMLFASAIALFSASTFGEIITISSRPADGSASPTDPPLYQENSGNWGNSTLKSSAPGLPSARGGSRFATSGTPSFSVTPTFAATNGTYYVEVTHGSAASISADLVVAIESSGATGLPETTDAFQQTKGVNSWQRIGALTLDGSTDSPTVTFTYASGATTGTAIRFYADGIRFINTNDVCLTGLPQLTTVNGPLAAGQTFVNVPVIDASATNVTVYAYDATSGAYTFLGDRSSGIIAGSNTVTTLPLVKGQTIVASQWKGGVESCLASSGPEVGGFNPSVRVSLSVRDTAGLPEIVGTNGGAAGVHLVLLKADGTVGGGFGVAPTGGQIITPSGCWQTLVFDRNVDSLFGWSGPYGDNIIANDWVTLDALAFALDDLTDTGPYQVYIDNIVNGTTLIQDFEGFTNGAPEVVINRPDFSSTTTPYLLSPAPGAVTPNLAVVTNTNASAGTNSVVLNWQFKDSSAQDWLRAAFQGAKMPNPVIDLRQRTYIDILLLPPGKTTADWTVGMLTNQSVDLNGSATFIATTTGAGTFTYQWLTNGVPVDGATGNSLTLESLQSDNSGSVELVVSNGGCEVRRVAALSVAQKINISIKRDAEGIVIVWPDTINPNARLEKTSDLTPPVSWTPVDVTPGLEGAAYAVHLPIGAGNEFFRLVIPAP